MTHRLVIVALAAFVLVGCGDGGAGDTGTTIAASTFEVTGYAHAGPVCPVAQNPPDPACDDRPVSGAELVVRESAGGEVASISTGEDGIFSVVLPPGAYSLVPQPVPGLMGTARPVELVVDGPVAGIDVAYDTGIR